MYDDNDEQLVLDLSHPGLHQAVEDFYWVIAGCNEEQVQRSMTLFREHIG